MSDFTDLANAAEPTVGIASSPAFFTVSIFKLGLMYIVTFGLYGPYWLYQNWRVYKQYSGSPIWPLPRTVFATIYLPCLFYKIDETFKAQGRGAMPYWAAYAFLLMLISISPLVIGFFIGLYQALTNGSPQLGPLLIIILSTVPFMLQSLVLCRVQSFINTLNENVDGSDNSSFSVWNWLWMAIGVVCWWTWMYAWLNPEYVRL